IPSEGQLLLVRPSAPRTFLVLCWILAAYSCVRPLGSSPDLNAHPVRSCGNTISFPRHLHSLATNHRRKTCRPFICTLSSYYPSFLESQFRKRFYSSRSYSLPFIT
ncbi:hypothetical protein BO82DRAFT_433253, partial [Aspergillus uvarum CBS 121591]